MRLVESIAGDPAHDRELIADEATRYLATLRDYTLDGQPRGISVAPVTFAAEPEPEAVALWACTVDTGDWLAADQQRPRTAFHLFDRQTLAYAGRFTDAITAYTDDIALHPGCTPLFPHGALFAVHADMEVVAFDLRDVADRLQLDRGCME